MQGASTKGPWAGHCQRRLRTSLQEDFRQGLARIGVPALVIHGDADRTVPIAASGLRTANLINGARLVTVPDGPHCIT
jgi:pimeloyl-ACP methyl ester carboxylesterase